MNYFETGEILGSCWLIGLTSFKACICVITVVTKSPQITATLMCKQKSIWPPKTEMLISNIYGTSTYQYSLLSHWRRILRGEGRVRLAGTWIGLSGCIPKVQSFGKLAAATWAALHWRSLLLMLVSTPLLLFSGELLAERCDVAVLTTWCQLAKYPCPLPSSKPCGPQSSGAERPHLSLSARWILDDQEVSTLRQSGDGRSTAAMTRWSSQVPEKPQSERLDLFRDWQAARDAPTVSFCSVPGVRNP